MRISNKSIVIYHTKNNWYKKIIYLFVLNLNKVLCNAMYYAKQCTWLNTIVRLSYDNVTPDNLSVTDIMSPYPHHIKRTPSY